jgi:hypothetical protein
MLVEAAGRRAVEQPPVMDHSVEPRFHRHRVEHRLQHRTTADDDFLDLVGLRPVL